MCTIGKNRQKQILSLKYQKTRQRDAVEMNQVYQMQMHNEMKNKLTLLKITGTTVEIRFETEEEQ